LNSKVIESDTVPSGATSIAMNEITQYSLSNDQWSLEGGHSGKPGVYVAPDGIGLGNGNFYVDASGTLTTHGDVKMYSTDEKLLLEIAGGSISLSEGAITWNARNTLILYGAQNYGYPGGIINENFEDKWEESNDSEWHRICQPKDIYVCYSYDNGATWTDATRISPGYIKSTYIDFSNVESPSIKTNNLDIYLTGKSEDEVVQNGISYGFNLYTSDADRPFFKIGAWQDSNTLYGYIGSNTDGSMATETIFWYPNVTFKKATKFQGSVDFLAGSIVRFDEDTKIYGLTAVFA
jgi:hypothetical protein